MGHCTVPGRALALLALPALALPVLGGCASGPDPGRLAEYDFRGHSVAVSTTTPPRPEFFPDKELDVSQTDGWLGAAVAVGSEIYKDIQLEGLRPRMDSAAAESDLSGLMSEILLVECARVLRARPAASILDADFEFEVRLTRVGITADNPDDDVYLFLEGQVRLLEARESSALIWEDRVEISQPLADGWKQEDYSVTSRVLDDVFTARALSGLTVEQLQTVLEYAAEDAGYLLADRLWQSVQDVERGAGSG